MQRNYNRTRLGLDATMTGALRMGNPWMHSTAAGIGAKSRGQAVCSAAFRSPYGIPGSWISRVANPAQ